MKLTEWLGVAGFALAVVSLLINLTLTWLKWPRIAVEVEHRIRCAEEGLSLPQTDTFVLWVINKGSEATTIRSIGFIEEQSGAARIDFLDAARSPVGEVRPTTPDGEIAVFPARINGHGCGIYEWDENALVTLARGRCYHGYAERYKSFRWWPKCDRSLVHRTLSEKSVPRSGPWR